MHGCPSRLHNVDRLMPMSVVNFFKRIPQIREGESADGRSHLQNGRGHASRKKHWEKHGNTNAGPQAYSSRMTAVPRRTMCDRSSTFHFVILHRPIRRAGYVTIRCTWISLCSFEPIHATPAGLYYQVSWPPSVVYCLLVSNLRST